MTKDLFVTIPNGNNYHLDLIHQIEHAVDKALIPLGFARTGTSHGENVIIEYYRFGIANNDDYQLPDYC